MATRCVWTMSVDWEKVVELLLLGCGRLIDRWDSRAWQYWRELGWNQRPSSELDTQPPEVQAYALHPREMLLLGVLPEAPIQGILFVLPDLRWAAVATETRIERIETEDE